MESCTRLHLVRHAHTDALGRILAGRGPGSLNAEGRTAAARLAQGLAGCSASGIFASPQPRARQTAEAIAAVLNLGVEIEPALDEVEFGDWTGQPFATLDSLPSWGIWNRHRSLATCPNGESMLDVQARIVSLVRRLHTDSPAREIILVSHGDVLKSLLAYMLCISIDMMQRVEIAPASHSLVVFREADVRVELLNRVFELQ